MLAGYYAKLMGLPVGKLVCASNANDVLTDFITAGTYDQPPPVPQDDLPVDGHPRVLEPRAPAVLPLRRANRELVSSLMADLAEKGAYTVPPALLTRLHETFACGRADDAATRETIRAVWNEHHVLLDPHTGRSPSRARRAPR